MRKTDFNQTYFGKIHGSYMVCYIVVFVYIKFTESIADANDVFSALRYFFKIFAKISSTAGTCLIKCLGSEIKTIKVN